MVMSLDVANAQYKMKPTKDVYRPNSGGSWASRAYAMPCGTTTKPTVTPGLVSPGTLKKAAALTGNDIAEQPRQVEIGRAHV